MKKQLLSLAVLCFLSMTHCVSVNLPQNQIKRSVGVQFQDPESPFTRYQSANVDAAWKNNRTGSIISLLSDCSAGYDPSLVTLRDEALSGLSQLRIEKQEYRTYAAREALFSRVRGKVDGIETFVDLVAVKKNGCSYLITLVAAPSAIEADRTQFEKFLSKVDLP